MRYCDKTVRIGKGLGISGKALAIALEEAGYRGPKINWGHMKYPGLNQPEAIKLSSNKKAALEAMNEAGVPVPPLNDFSVFPVIGRTSYHTRGSGLWFCNDMDAVDRAKAKGATHFLRFIPDAREFRVHIVQDNCIKISDKNKRYDPEKMDWVEGKWTYPHDFKRKVSLREVGKEAVKALGLDFGAVDILYRKEGEEHKFYVLEVNTAPALTESINNDTMNRWVDAFMKLEEEEEKDESIEAVRHESDIRLDVRGGSSPSQGRAQIPNTDEDLPLRPSLSPNPYRSFPETWRRKTALQMSALQSDIEALKRDQAQEYMQRQRAIESQYIREWSKRGIFGY